VTTSEWIGWLLAMFLCVIFPLALGYYGLALAGAGGLGVLAWRIFSDRRKSA